jgi:hypothetical protein
MSARFVACPACARHMRAGECLCPFCGAKAACAKPLRRIGERLTRAAMHAAGAAGAVVALGDCTYQTGTPAYGVPCTPDVCAPVYEDSGADTSTAADGSEAASDASADSTEDVANESGVADGPQDDATVDAAGDAPTDAPADGPDGG